MRILLLLVILSTSLASQPIAHILIGKAIFTSIDQPLGQLGISKISPVIKPLSIMAGHLIQDRLVNDATLGEWQVEIGIVRVIIGYYLTPKEQQNDYLYYAFWSLLPDIIDKTFNTNYFHNYSNNYPIFELTRDQNELIDESILLSFAMEI